MLRALAAVLAAVSVMGVITLGVGDARAQQSTEQLRAARALADAGFELYRAGDYPEAYKRFRDAEAIFHAPPHVLFMARSAAKLGRVVEARDLLRDLAAETLPPDSPQPFRDAQAEAASEVEVVSARVARLSLRIIGPDTPTLLVDGTARDVAAAGTLDLDPGEHHLEIGGAGFETDKRNLTLAEGASESLAVELVALPHEPTEPTTEPLMEDGPLWPGFAMAGFSAATFAAGGALGLVAIDKADQLQQACPQRDQCLRENEGLKDDALLFGNLSTVAFVTGGVAAAGAVVWFILRPGGGPSDGVPVEGEAGWIRPWLAPGLVGVEGAF
jgi:hypothetical protein